MYAIVEIAGQQFKVEKENDQLRFVTEDDEIKSSTTGGSLNAILDMYNKEIPEQLN